MGAKPAFCSVCNRSVYVSHTDSLSCPVCSTPLLEAASIPSEDDSL